MEYLPTWDMAMKGLADAEQAAVEAQFRVVGFRRGATLYEESVRRPELFVVRKGRVKTLFVDAAGREHIVRIVSAGTLLGIATNLADVPPTVTVRAIEDVQVHAIHRDDLLASMHRIPALAVNVARLAAAMYTEQLIAMKAAGDSAPVRLGKILCDLASLQGPRDHQSTVIAGLTHQDLAAMVGASRTWVTLMLAGYEQRGVLRCGRGVIDIHDPRALSDYVTALERETA